MYCAIYSVSSIGYRNIRFAGNVFQNDVSRFASPLTDDTFAKHRGHKVQNPRAFRKQICARGYDEAKVATQRLINPFIKVGDGGLLRFRVNTARPLKLFAYLAGIYFDFSVRLRPAAKGACVILCYNNLPCGSLQTARSTSALVIPNFRYIRRICADLDNGRRKFSCAAAFSPGLARIHAVCCSPIEKLYLIESSDGFVNYRVLRTLGEL